MEASEKKYIDQIRVTADHMESLVSGLLSLSKVGRVVSTFTEVPALDIVKRTASSLGDSLEKNGIKLVVEKNLPTIYCDRERIYQVFENLLSNAVKFVQESKNPQIEVGYEEKEAFHQFYVRDNGIGIDPKYHRRIFKMFRRLEEAKDREGSGLGLAIVSRIIQHHGGKVWVESEKGKGATFYFTLPKKP